jgi:hypothetical protein
MVLALKELFYGVEKQGKTEHRNIMHIESLYKTLIFYENLVGLDHPRGKPPKFLQNHP